MGRRIGKLLGCALIPALAAACTSPGNDTPGRPGDATIVPVTRVVDGDTFHVRYLARDDRVRLIGVDTPEVSWYGGHGECFGVTAATYARARLSGRSVGLRFDRARRDGYGRLLAYVYLGDELFNLTLVRLGYARDDPVPPDTRLAGLFSSAETEARTAGAGLWAACP